MTAPGGAVRVGTPAEEPDQLAVVLPVLGAGGFAAIVPARSAGRC